MQPDHTQQSDDTLWFVLIIAVGGLWLLTAALVYPAAFLASGQGPGIGFRKVLSAAPRAFASAGDPASAFPEPAASRLPGPVGYWADPGHRRRSPHPRRRLGLHLGRQQRRGASTSGAASTSKPNPALRPSGS